MIGIDIGGANIKIVDDGGVHIHYCPLWKGGQVKEILSEYRGNQAAVVMTGELADCFSNKWEGITSIVRIVKEIFPNALFYGTDARFHRRAMPQLAAANWLATADYLLPRHSGSLLVDIGSTTTDIIPLNRVDDLKGLTDIERLQRGFLVYNGLLRTNVATFVRTVIVNDHSTPLSSELFAITADIHLVLGQISISAYTCSTPDGMEGSREASLHRVARIVCSDIEEVGGERGVINIARQVGEQQKKLIRRSVAKIKKLSGVKRVLVCGIGAPIFTDCLKGIDLHAEFGSAADALPSLAVREMAIRIAG